MKTNIITEKESLFSRKRLKSVKKELLHTIISSSIIWQISFFYLPLFFLLVKSFLAISPITNSYTITFQHFKPILNSTYYKVIGNSLLLSFTTSILSVVIALPLSYCLIFKTKRWKYPLLFLIIIPFWTNFLLHIYAWFFILENNGPINQILLTIGAISKPMQLLHTYPATVILMIYYYLPFVTLPIFFSLEKFNKTYYEASLTLGATKIKTLHKIVLPVIKKSIINGFFLAFIPAFGEFLIPEFIGGDKTYYVGNVIFLFLIGENTENIGLAFTALAIVILLIVSYVIYRLLNALFSYLSGSRND